MLRIENNGECYICTSSFHNISLGNIFEKSFEEIWNGKIIQKIRKNIFENSDYSNCRTDLCLKYNEYAIENYQFQNPFDLKDEKYAYYADVPKLIYFAFDYSCKQKCIFCRDKVAMMQNSETEKWKKVFKEKILPIIKYVKIVELNHAGEFLDGSLSLSIIEDMLFINPKLKFNLISNGVSFNKSKIEKLGIQNKINTIHISLHSATKETYKKIFRNDNFDEVIKNIEYISKLKNEGKIKNFEIMFVICSLNYKDMPLFVSLCEKYNARPAFSLMNMNCNSEYGCNKLEYAVFDRNHRDYNKFVKVLKNNSLKKYINSMPPCLSECKYLNPIEVFYNYVAYIKNKKK